MKLKAKIPVKEEVKVEKKSNEENTKKAENVRRGKNAKRKGGQYERDIAKKFQKKYGIELKRTPQSGGFAKKSTKADDFRGDITIVDDKLNFKLHVECKCHKTWSLPKWIEQATGDCPKNKTPIIVFHQHNSSKDFVCLSLEDFFNLVEKNKIVERRTFND